MLLSSVAAKTIRDRARLAVGIGVSLAVVTFAFGAIASDLGDEVANLMDELPDALSGMIGGAGTNYIIAEMFGLLAPIAILVIAIGGGVGAVAGEEARGTADLLLTLPVTRRHVVMSKAAVLVANLTAACVLFAIGAAVAAATLSMDGFTAGNAVATVVHLFFLGVAFAMIALAAGSVTGSTAAATVIAGGLAAISNLVAGVLPLIDGAGSVAKVSPWYYFNGSNPLVNGIDVAHLAVLAAIAVAGFAIAIVALERRDIGARSHTFNVDLAAINSVVRPHVASVFVKTLTERFMLITITAGSLALLAVAMAGMYDGIAATLTDFSDSLPAAFDDLLGTSDIGTPEGWIQAEMLSILVPLALIVVGIVMGIGAIAGEDDRRTLGLLVATPITRSRIVVAKAAAIVAAVLIVGLVSWSALVAGSGLFSLGIRATSLAASMTHITLGAVFFGLLGLAIGAAAKKTTALRATVAVAAATYLGQWLVSTQSGLDGLALLSPWHYMVAADPLYDGVDVGHLGVLAALAGVALTAAVLLFDRREING